MDRIWGSGGSRVCMLQGGRGAVPGVSDGRKDGR